jgi:hypothetical protein
MRLERSDGTTNAPTPEESDFFRVDEWWHKRNHAYLDGALDVSLPLWQRDLGIMAHAQEETRRLEEKEYFMRQHRIERIIKEKAD